MSQRMNDPTRQALRSSAKLGDAETQFRLGCNYDRERPKNRNAAIRWYRKAAQQGHAEAQAFLAESYRDGWSVPKNVKTAAMWYGKAAAQGHPNAQLGLGYACFYGEVVDHTQAAAAEDAHPMPHYQPSYSRADASIHVSITWGFVRNAHKSPNSVPPWMLGSSPSMTNASGVAGDTHPVHGCRRL